MDLRRRSGQLRHHHACDSRPHRVPALRLSRPSAGPQPTCETAGVLNAIVSAVASLQVADALKILSGHADLVQPRITTTMCGKAESARSMVRRRTPIAPPARAASFLTWKNRPAPGAHVRPRRHAGPRARSPIDLEELRARLEPLGEVRSSEFALRFLIPPYN